MVISLINLLLVIVSFLFALLTIFQSRNRISIKSQIKRNKPNHINDWVCLIWSITPLVNNSFRTDSQE